MSGEATKAPVRVYLDACCLNRPFDDQSQSRVRLETIALQAVLAACEAGSVAWVSSDVLRYEVEQTPSAHRRDALLVMLAQARRQVSAGLPEFLRCHHLMAWGIAKYDALHVACAESAGVECFVTVDDRLRRRLAARRGDLQVQVIDLIGFVTGSL